jgi:hypothetical protein
MSNSVEDQRQVVQVRLEETLVAFQIGRLINERADQTVNPDLNVKIQERGGFWQATLLSHQSVLFTGLDALLDDKRNDVATLYSYAKAVDGLADTTVPFDLLSNLPAIRNKYKTYRHKLFAHTDFDRPEFAKQFDGEGFTFQTLGDDLTELEYVYKALSYLATHAQMISTARDAQWKVVTRAKVGRLNFPYEAYVAKVIDDTERLLSDL